MAEHPGTMAPDDYDLSGFCVGAVDKSDIIDGSAVAAGDVVLGLASSGVHSNGFSLVRKVLIENRADQKAAVRETPDQLGGMTTGDALLTPTRIYVPQVMALIDGGIRPHAIAHITGGGITENLDRVLPADLDAQVARGSWPALPIIDYIVETAGLSDEEAYKTFNMGIGLMLIVSPEQVDEVRRLLDEEVYEIGTIVPGSGKVVYR